MFHRSVRLMPVAWFKTAVLSVLLVTYGRPTIVDGHSYHTQHWTTEHGLPQNTVKALVQTRDGYLWIGTLSGLARFDGVRFTVYTQADTPWLKSDTINALAEDSRGSLWIGTTDGLVEWGGGAARRWTMADGLTGGNIQQVIATSTNTLWCRELTRVLKLENGKVTVFGPEQGLVHGIVRIIKPSGNGVLVATELGIQRLDPEASRFGELIPWPGPGVGRRVLQTSTGTLWADSEQGCFEWQRNRWNRFKEAEGFNDPIAGPIFEDRAQGLWFSSKEGNLQRWHAGRFMTVTTGAQRGVSCSYEDREGNLWIGTGGSGLYRLRPNRIRTWTTADGLPDNRVRPLTATADGSVWAGTEAGPVRILRGKVETFSAVLPQLRVDRLCVDRAGVWVAYQGHAVFRLEGGSQRIVENLPFQWISTMYEGRKGDVWFADREAAVFRGGQWIKPFPGFTFDRSVRAMLEDCSGAIWFGTGGAGLYRIKDGQTARFTAADGLCDNSPSALHEDTDGAIWVGSNGGLNRYKDGKLARIRLEHGLVENTVNQILEDDFGDFWLSGLRGIHRVSRADLNAVADGRSRRVQCLTYGEADGMARSETNGDFQPAGCKTPDGHLWFPTDMGVVEINPVLMRESEREVPIVIEQVLAEDKVVFPKTKSLVPLSKPDASPVLTFARGTGRFLEIRFTAASFLAPEKVRFQYKLEPTDTEWREAGSQRFAFFHNLRPGRYTFAVRACNPHGLWNERPAWIAFIVEPHFWQTRLFYALCGIAVISLATGFTAYRLRWQRRLLNARHEQALAEERARIARDLHDDLGTALTGVALEIDLVRRQPMDSMTARLGESASHVRTLAERMREVVWAVNPRCDTVSSLASFLEQQAGALLQAGGVRGRLEFPEDIPALPLNSETRHQLALGVREALTNTLRHAQATEAVVSLSLSAQALTVSVRDNGRGFDMRREDAASGHGLHNLRARLAQVGGTVTIDSKPGAGTRVEFRVPLNRPPSQRTIP